MNNDNPIPPMPPEHLGPLNPLVPMTREQARIYLNGLEPASTPALDPKPYIPIPGGYITITQSSELLFAEIGPRNELFRRGDTIVEVVEVGDEVKLQRLDATAAQSRFEKYATFVKRKYIGGVAVDERKVLTKAIAEQYLASKAAQTLPNIKGLVQFPLLVETDNGLYLVQDGYNADTEIFVSSRDTVDEIGLEIARERIGILVNDFHFLTPGDRSRAIASLLTPALKFGGLIRGPIPIDVAEANHSQSGKTYRQKVIAAVYNQTLAGISQSHGGVGGLEEKLSQALAEGRAFIQLDNLRGNFKSELLESFITSDEIAARVPYQPNVMVDPTKHVLFISSNGFETTKDLANRSSIIRIVKREVFQFARYKGLDLLEAIRDDYTYFLAAVFAVVRHWHTQGKPKTGDMRHDMREWAQSLDWIVVNIIGEAPLMNGHDDAKRRASSPNLGFIRALALAVEKQHRLGERLRASALAMITGEEAIEIPGLGEAGRNSDRTPEKQIGRLMKEAFATEATITVEQFTVTRTEDGGPNQSGNWQLSHVYIFRLTQNPQADPSRSLL